MASTTDRDPTATGVPGCQHCRCDVSCRWTVGTVDGAASAGWERRKQHPARAVAGRPKHGRRHPVLSAANVRAAVVSVSPDGRSVAYLQQDQSAGLNGVTYQRLDSVWIAGAPTAGMPVRLFALPPLVPAGAQGSGEVEGIRDVTWTPDGHHLLVAVRLLSVSGGYPAAARTRLLLLDASVAGAEPTTPVELVVLPAEVVPGSYSWAPDGHWVAFLSTASEGSGSGSFVALCAVDTSANGAVDGFRYVADLGRQTDSVEPAADRVGRVGAEFGRSTGLRGRHTQDQHDEPARAARHLRWRARFVHGKPNSAGADRRGRTASGIGNRTHRAGVASNA